MIVKRPEWLDPTPWLAAAAAPEAVTRALSADLPGPGELAALLSPSATPWVEAMARRAQALTQRHFGRTIALYAPLYLSDHCSGGCLYCGFASDRSGPRRRLSPDEIAAELSAMKEMGIEEVLLLSGERAPEADFVFVRRAVELAASRMHAVTVEAFPMTTEEYRELAAAGCTGVTLYQETYDPAAYDRLHRWGPKRDYAARLDAPSRVLESGIRTVGLGVLLGLAEPVADALSLYLHVGHLRRRWWASGVSVSFPRVCPQAGGFTPPHPVNEAFLARMIFAFRIALPDVPLVLSTRERAAFRDGMAGLGIAKMSAASRTTVGGYRDQAASRDGQFHVYDDRDVDALCRALAARGLEPVFKNWDDTFRPSPAMAGTMKG